MAKERDAKLIVGRGSAKSQVCRPIYGNISNILRDTPLTLDNMSKLIGTPIKNEDGITIGHITEIYPETQAFSGIIFSDEYLKFSRQLQCALNINHVSGMAGETSPYSVSPCLAFKPKPEYILKENPSYTELRKELERLQEDGAKISRELEVWMNSVNTTIGLLRHKEAEIDKLRRIKNEITVEKESE